jgi:4-hydroxy-3-methylbut-2-enyl diphosphate reductase
MKINLAKSAGFCFGVRRAINIALKAANSRDKIYMLGDIVHNEDVIKLIEKTGIKKINRLSDGKNKTLLIRAHGTSRKAIDRASALGYKIIDATCPMVKDIHRIAQEMEKKGYRVMIIGDKKHDEVHGIIGQLKRKAIVVDSLKHIPVKTIKKIKKAALVVQSTQNLERVIKIVGALKLYIQELKFFNTVCNPTRLKQEEIKRMPQENDVMIIIGSKTSANTRRLYEIAKSLNRRSYWVQSKDDIKLKWFKAAESAGVTAGASTPNSTTEQVIEYIKEII